MTKSNKDPVGSKISAGGKKNKNNKGKYHPPYDDIPQIGSTEESWIRVQPFRQTLSVVFRPNPKKINPYDIFYYHVLAGTDI